MQHAWHGGVWGVLVLLLAGCEGQRPAPPTVGRGSEVGTPDAELVQAADISILFVGNSIPGLVRKMIEFQHPEKKVCTHVIGVGFLEEMARDRRAYDEIEARPWKLVVLQAQKISMSGRFQYSRTEGVDFARLAKSKGASVFFFSEWGRQGVVGDGEDQEKIYQEMADAAGVRVMPIGRAWDLALARRPDLTLYNADGNYQSAIGAFLTGCAFCCILTGESPASLASFPFPDVTNNDRTFLADAAAQVVVQKN
jgi:hypothetical protein